MLESCKASSNRSKPYMQQKITRDEFYDIFSINNNYLNALNGLLD
jgi:hypothetical protein